MSTNKQRLAVLGRVEHHPQPHKTARWMGKCLGQMRRVALYQAAKELGITNVGGMAKSELVALLEERIGEVGAARATYGAFSGASHGRDQEVPRAFTAAGNLRGERKDPATPTKPRESWLSRPDHLERG